MTCTMLVIEKRNKLMRNKMMNIEKMSATRCVSNQTFFLTAHYFDIPPNKLILGCAICRLERERVPVCIVRQA